MFCRLCLVEIDTRVSFRSTADEQCTLAPDFGRHRPDSAFAFPVLDVSIEFEDQSMQQLS